MSSTRKSRLASWLSAARHDLDQVAAEVDQMHDDEPQSGVGEELDEVRARLNALESRVKAIEGPR